MSNKTYLSVASGNIAIVILFYNLISNKKIFKKKMLKGRGGSYGQDYLHYLGRQVKFCLRAKQILLILNCQIILKWKICKSKEIIMWAKIWKPTAHQIVWCVFNRSLLSLAQLHKTIHSVQSRHPSLNLFLSLWGNVKNRRSSRP